MAHFCDVCVSVGKEWLWYNSNFFWFITYFAKFCFNGKELCYHSTWHTAGAVTIRQGFLSNRSLTHNYVTLLLTLITHCHLQFCRQRTLFFLQHREHMTSVKGFLDVPLSLWLVEHNIQNVQMKFWAHLIFTPYPRAPETSTSEAEKVLHSGQPTPVPG